MLLSRTTPFINDYRYVPSTVRRLVENVDEFDIHCSTDALP